MKPLLDGLLFGAGAGLGLFVVIGIGVTILYWWEMLRRESAARAGQDTSTDKSETATAAPTAGEKEKP